MTKENRRAQRLLIDVEVAVDVIGPSAKPSDLYADNSYERIVFPSEFLGESFSGQLCNLSTNGAMIKSTLLPPPLSRLSLMFELPGYGDVGAIALVMWRNRVERRATAEGGDGDMRKPGFGVLFEAIALEARIAIQALIDSGMLGDRR